MKQNQLVKNASYFSVITGVLILLVKALGWLKSDSVSLFASLVDSLLDVTSSLLNVIAIHIALAPADDNHRFGHDKVQDLAIFGQAIFFIASGAFTFFVSTKKLIYANYVIKHDTGVISMTICSLLVLLLLGYQSYVVRITNSQIIKSDRIHYTADLASNVSVIISIIASQYIPQIDAIFAIFISFYIIFSATKLLKHSIKNLIDEEFSKEDKEKILQTLKNNNEILGVHDLKTRRAGNKAFIQFHIDLEPSISLIKAHNISDQVCQELSLVFPNSEIIIHQDPLGYDDDVQYRENIK
jgi:cation diffusion facilitator family transporter